jgi:hypothetical protein
VSSSQLDDVVLLSDELPRTEADSETNVPRTEADSETDVDELLTTTCGIGAEETAAAVTLCDFIAFFLALAASTLRS